MSSEIHVGGEITVRPPVPTEKLAGSKFLPETARAQDSEVFVIVEGDGRSLIVPTHPEGWTYDPDMLQDDIAELVNLIGDGHTYSGELRIDTDTPSRVRVIKSGDGWMVVEDDAQVIWPADYAIPGGPAVVVADLGTLRSWLDTPNPDHTPGEHFNAHPDVMYQPENGDSPADWLCRMLNDPAAVAPHWRTAPGIEVEVVETIGEGDAADGGAVLVVRVGEMRLASRWLTAADLATYDTDENGSPNVPRSWAAAEALVNAADVVNHLVEQHRLNIAAETAATNPFQRGLLALFPPDDIETALLALADLWTSTDPPDVLSAHQRQVVERLLAVTVDDRTDAPEPPAARQ